MVWNGIYSILFLCVIVAALADWFRFQGDRTLELHETSIVNGKLWRARYLIAGWVVFQLGCAYALYKLGIGKQAFPQLAFNLSAMVVLPFVLISGGYWTLRAGSPFLPLLGASAGTDPLIVPPPLPHPAPTGYRNNKIIQFLALTTIPLASVALLLTLVPWQTDTTFARSSTGHSVTFKTVLFLGYVLISAAVLEEIVARHYLLNRLLVLFSSKSHSRPGSLPITRSAVSVPIAIVTLFWAMGHLGMIDPPWVKFTQICIYGIALGIAQIRLGLESCIALHLIFNGAAVAFALFRT